MTPNQSSLFDSSASDSISGMKRQGQIQEECPTCHKLVFEKFSFPGHDSEGNDIRLITLSCFHTFKKILPKATPYETLVSNWWRNNGCQHDWTKNTCNQCGEHRLFNFQIIGARNIEAALAIGKGHGIFDDMGLGKTIQVLAYIRFHVESTPTLYVVKSSLKFKWLKEIIRWLGPEYLGQIINTGKDSILPGFKSYIIAYDLLRNIDKVALAAIGIKLVILDECQQIKNPDSTRTSEVRRILMDQEVKVIGVSGTPWKNRGSEFFPVLNMMAPLKFPSYQRFCTQWVDSYYDGSRLKMGGISNVKRFREYTEGLITRREYNEVMDEFPDINKMRLTVQLDEMEQKVYDSEVSEFVSWYNDAVIGGDEESLSGIEVLARMARMRHITGIAKIPATLGFIEEFVEDCERKLVIFVHHQDVGKLLYDSLVTPEGDWSALAKELKARDIPVLKLTAAMSPAERFETSEYFNTAKRAILVASTLAAGEGIDLQTCSDAVMHERQWNPQNEEQAFPGRFRRIGQLASVLNGTFIQGEDTIDEYLDGLVEEKLRQFHLTMNKSELPSWNDSSLGKDLAAIIVNKFNVKNKSNKEFSVTKAAQLIKKVS